MRIPSLVALGLAAAIVAACGDSTEPNPSGNSPNISAISGDAFDPKFDTVAVGTTVTWTNDDAVAHTTTSDTGVWDSGSLAPGGTFTRTFDQAGSFPYHCEFHGGPGTGMFGTLVVR